MSSHPHSLIFCNQCGALLDPPLGTEEHVQCLICSGIVSAEQFECINVVTKSRPNAFPIAKISESIDQNAHLHEGATIKEKCPKCDASEMVFHTAQLRSADEGQTVFYNCVKCGYKYSINS